jgi:hypothetical protein
LIWLFLIFSMYPVEYLEDAPWNKWYIESDMEDVWFSHQWTRSEMTKWHA